MARLRLLRLQQKILFQVARGGVELYLARIGEYLVGLVQLLLEQFYFLPGLQIVLEVLLQNVLHLKVVQVREFRIGQFLLFLRDTSWKPMITRI